MMYNIRNPIHHTVYFYMKSFFHTVKQSFLCVGRAILRQYERFSAYAERRPIRIMLMLALLLNLLTEILSRRSPIEGVAFALLHPYVFCLNALIVFLTLSLSLLFARRAFALVLISVGWLILGIANCVILGMRNTPLAAIDFGLITSCFDIITVYLSIPALLLILIAFLLVVLGLIKLFRVTKKLGRPSFSRLRSLVFSAFLWGISACILLFSVGIGALETAFADLPGAYGDYGFAYCFSLSVLDRGVDRPEDYSDTEIDAILGELDAQSTALWESDTQPTVSDGTPHERPNIIFVQLESFFDVNRLRGMSFSENPVPVFSALKAQYPSGYLTVPSIGAGTANTEFEILTGMNLDDFGAGEYPYKTVLRRQTTESIAFNLRNLGYTAHAVHNNTGAFYDRNKVYSSLGFDTFTSLEYMQDVSYNPLGWAKDACLTDSIRRCLSSTDGADFVFAVSVQPHGRYPDEEATADNAYDTTSLLDRLFDETENDTAPGGNLTGNVTTELTEAELAAQRIDVMGIADAGLAAQYRYYVNQLAETDAFIGALTDLLSVSDEKTVVVFYGDHLPYFDYTENDFADGSTPFETEYVIWSNYDIQSPANEAVTDSMPAYRLAATVLDRLSIHEGIITRLHQTQSGSADHLAALEMLEYDMLYGDMEAWNGINPHLPTMLTMGIDPIRVSSLRTVGNALYVTGENFTPFSVVKIGDTLTETVFINAATLLVPDAPLPTDMRVSVVQAGSERIVLSESNAVRYQP